jgi:hypothetical protein
LSSDCPGVHAAAGQFLALLYDKVLIEAGFLSSAADARMLASSAGRGKIARALADEIVNLRKTGILTWSGVMMSSQ